MASWDEKLLTAAFEGNIKEVELCVKNRANLECRGFDGRTPLIWAAGVGHLEIVTYLATHGSQLDATSTVYGQTPLMLAAGGGHLEVVIYLVTHGSQLDVKDRWFGRTALHYAAVNGQIDVTKCLIDQGCSPWVKSKQGETPYDLVTTSRFCTEKKKKEVIDFLKTVMSKTSPEVTPDTRLQEPAAPVVEDNKIPEQIKKMDHESIAIYLNALESGSERRRDINLIIVGKKSVGKTSLVRRLFGEELQSVKSTNGIEIHRRRCRINLSNWEWNKLLDTRLVKEASINNRILQSIVKEWHQEKEKPKHDILEISSSDQISTDDNKGTITKNIEKDEEPQPKMNYQFAYPEITESPLSKLAKDELLSIIGSAVDLQDEDGYANLTVWDFAGDIEYYNTHQTFLNSEAIFLVVANLHDTDDTVSYGTFNFWMDTIHCYGSINDKTEAVLLEGAHNLLDPPVIAIGTHKDKFQDEEQCRKRLESYTDKIFKDSKLHLRSIHLISNTEDEEDAFAKLRNDIFSTAKSSANWNREYPVKFIQMEKAINSELTIGKQIISFKRLKELGEKIPLPITDDKELHLFLRYQHEIGNVIFFEDIPSYIILDPQWLANAFTCIVTAQQFQLELPHLQWDNFKQTGKMDPKLLEEIFKKQTADMRIHKEHILEVIEKFDIIIYPLLLTESGNVQREHSFYVPCMLQTLKIKDIDVLFNVPNASKSTCLCFVFSFLPPYLISNLIVSCLREYPLAVVKGELGLFKDCCVFNIDRTGCAKFVLAKCSHMIQLQVWQWNEVDTKINQAVLKIVEREINRIINTRYKLKTVSFEKKWKCETTSFSFDTGFFEFDQVHDGKKYYCEEHATTHKYKDYWSGEKSKAPGRLSSEEQNYVRMSKIVLEVLSGVLYDRLFLDTKTGEILDRKKLDITEMCKKYCALKINFPSKGFRKIEEVDQISTNEDAIGDDIQRIRVIRNEMLHSSVFALDDTRYQTLITIVHDMLTRFDQHNNPAGESYVKRLDEIRKMELETRSFEEIKERMKAGLIEKIEKIHAVVDSVVSDALNDIC
ncbi:death-associated protein kinase 1-like [Mytilus trossulus]|uniref:death-associated protein kinase 1-like n=1 Tax=Mytilus trossulus TaxID=6551 RepID=UPI003007E60D